MMYFLIFAFMLYLIIRVGVTSKISQEEFALIIDVTLMGMLNVTDKNCATKNSSRKSCTCQTCNKINTEYFIRKC